MKYICYKFKKSPLSYVYIFVKKSSQQTRSLHNGDKLFRILKQRLFEYSSFTGKILVFLDEKY